MLQSSSSRLPPVCSAVKQQQKNLFPSSHISCGVSRRKQVMMVASVEVNGGGGQQLRHLASTTSKSFKTCNSAPMPLPSSELMLGKNETSNAGVSAGYFNQIVRQRANTPKDNSKLIFLSDVFPMWAKSFLPPASVCEKMIDAKLIFMTVSEQRTLVQAMIDYAINNRSFKGRIDDMDHEIILKLCKRNIKDLTTLGTVLSNSHPDSYVLGFWLLQIAKDNGNLDAAFRYAQMLSTGGKSVAKDHPLARSLVQELSNKGHGPAQYAFAMILLESGLTQSRLHSSSSSNNKKKHTDHQRKREIEKDVKEGLRLLHASAKSGVVPAAAQLGYLYQRGILVMKDIKLALQFLTAASNKGHTESSYLLANHYNDGNGVKMDKQKAMQLYEVAANKGLAVAQHNLGCALLVEKKEVWKAVEYWKMAADQNFGFSNMNLGKLYLNGYPENISKDERHALKKKDPLLVVEPDAILAREYFTEVAKGPPEDPLVREAKAALRLLPPAPWDGNSSEKSSSKCLVM